MPCVCHRSFLLRCVWDHPCTTNSKLMSEADIFGFCFVHMAFDNDQQTEREEEVKEKEEQEEEEEEEEKEEQEEKEEER